MTRQERYVAYAAAAIGGFVARGLSISGEAAARAAEAHTLARFMLESEPSWLRDDLRTTSSSLW